LKRLLLIIVTLTLLPPAPLPTAANQTVLPAPLPNDIAYVPGSTQKVCQLTGELDRHFQRPTVNQTATRFGMLAADHAYSFEHNGTLVFLFGDAPPTARFNGKPNRQIDPPRSEDFNDAIGFTTDTAIDDCPRLEFTRNENGAFKNPLVLNAQGQPAIRLRTNESPKAGISQGGRMYVLFGTDNPTGTARPPGPLGYPTRTAMAVSDDDGNTFRYLYDFSAPPEMKFIDVAIAQGPDGYLYFWGTQGGDLHRRSAVYFARKRGEQIDQPSGTEFFAGLDADGMPIFSASEADAFPLFMDYERDPAQPENCMGEIGVEWNPFVQRWVILYNCGNNTPANPRGIYMRLAEQPWGPWTTPQTIFNPLRDGGTCVFIHRAVTLENPACDEVSDPNRLDIQGGAYGPFFISRFTTGDEAARSSTFYYAMATWNPYGQVIMRSTIQAASSARASIH
jgi:hypothetical protein